MLLSEGWATLDQLYRRDTLQQSDEYRKVHSAQYNSALAAPNSGNLSDGFDGIRTCVWTVFYR